jgi:hypothetical protein
MVWEAWSKRFNRMDFESNFGYIEEFVPLKMYLMGKLA